MNNLIISSIIIILILLSSCNTKDANTDKGTKQSKVKTESAVNVGDKEGRRNTVEYLQKTLPEHYKETNIFMIPWTEEDYYVGMKLFCTQGDGAWGPDGIALDKDRNIYILDNGVVIYSESGQYIRSYSYKNIELANIETIEVSADGRYLYGTRKPNMGSKYIYIYDTKNGQDEKVMEDNGHIKRVQNGYELYDSDNKIVRRIGESKNSMSEREEKDKMKELVTGEYKRIFDSGSLKMARTYGDGYQEYNHLRCYFVGNDSLNNYYIATYYRRLKDKSDGNVSNKIVIYKYRETGEMLGVIELKEEEIDYLNFDFAQNIYVVPSGDIYYLCPVNEGAMIIKYSAKELSSVSGIENVESNMVSISTDSIYETVYEHEYADTIVDAIFDTATVSIEEAKKMGWGEEYIKRSSKNDKVEIVYPKVLMTKDSLKFMDRKGNMNKGIELNVRVRSWDKEVDEIRAQKIEIRVSDNEKYLGILIPRDVNMLEGMMMGDLVIYNTDGEEQWSLDSVFLSDGDIRISPNGEYAIEMIRFDFERLPYYMSREGIKQIKYNSKEYARGVKVEFEEINNGYILLVEDTILIKYSKSAKQEWDIITEKVYNIAHSSKYNIFLINSLTKLLEIDSSGAIKHTYNKNDTAYSIAYMLTSEGKYIISWPRKQKMSLIDMQRGEIWHNEVKSLQDRSWPINIAEWGDNIIVEHQSLQTEAYVGLEGYVYYNLSGEIVDMELSSIPRISMRHYKSQRRLQTIPIYQVNNQKLYTYIENKCLIMSIRK